MRKLHGSPSVKVATFNFNSSFNLFKSRLVDREGWPLRCTRTHFASSSNPDEVEYYVGLLGVEDLLAGTTSKEDAEFSKPSPEIFQAALDRVKSDPARTFAVGDTPYDILAAHRVPLPVIAVRCGGFPDETLAKAEYVFDDLVQMTGELDRIDEYFRK